MLAGCIDGPCLMCAAELLGAQGAPRCQPATSSACGVSDFQSKGRTLRTHGLPGRTAGGNKDIVALGQPRPTGVRGGGEAQPPAQSGPVLRSFYVVLQRPQW